jgi:hypothetical protein
MRQGQLGQPTAWGRGVGLAAVAGGIISRYAVRDGHPDARAPLPPSLKHHLHQCGPSPALLTGDRGLHATANARAAQQRGVTEGGLPKPGQKAAQRIADEQQDWLRAGRHWRAGIEGRSRGRKRRHRLDRCGYPGTGGLERGVGRGVIAHQRHVIAPHLAA